MKFEIHLTFYFKDAWGVVAIGRQFHWKYSVFEGDPILGKDKYFYLTKYADSKEKALEYIAAIKVELETQCFPLIREKIEEIVHDIRHIDVRGPGA